MTTSILLTLSLVLNMIAILSIILLYLRQNRLLQLETKQNRTLKETEEFFSGCILQFKEENELFIKKLQELDKADEAKTVVGQTATVVKDPVYKAKPTQQMTENGEESLCQNATEKVKLPDPDHPKGNVYQAVQAYKNTPIVDEEKVLQETLVLSREKPKAKEQKQEPPSYEKGLKSSNLYIQSLLNQALLLQKQGYSLEEIARSLNKGKTELELLFKFRQKG